MSAQSSSRTLGELADEHGRADRLHEPAVADASAETVDVATNSNGRLLSLQACPNCQREFRTLHALVVHLEARDPEHYGLAPKGEGRNRSTAEIFDGGRYPFETGDNRAEWIDAGLEAHR